MLVHPGSNNTVVTYLRSTAQFSGRVAGERMKVQDNKTAKDLDEAATWRLELMAYN